MRLLAVGACAVVAVALAGTASSSGSAVPRFSLGVTSAAWDADVALRVERSPVLRRQHIRLYLVRLADARAVRTRFDPRLHFVGTVPAARNARLRLRVPPLDAGRHALSYWCPGCLPQGVEIGVQRSPALRVTAPAGEGCPTTRPTTLQPPGAHVREWALYGNGALWALVPRPGLVTANALGGYKLPWVATQGRSSLFTVRYQMLDGNSEVRVAQTVSGTLMGYDGPSWASRMSFEPGCWQITGRVLDVSLSFVVQVERGAG